MREAWAGVATQPVGDSLTAYQLQGRTGHHFWDETLASKCPRSATEALIPIGSVSPPKFTSQYRVEAQPEYWATDRMASFQPRGIEELA